MIYKWVKRLLLLSVLVSVLCGMALATGWIGLQRVPLIIQLLLVTTGLYVFYQTRREKVRTSWMVWPVMLVHVLVLPLMLVMLLSVRSEALAQAYWFMVNLCMVICLGVTWLLLLGNLLLPALVRALLVLVSTAYLVLLALHMCGQFNNGQVIFFSGIIIFLGTILLVLFGIKKPQAPEGQTPTAE